MSAVLAPPPTAAPAVRLMTAPRPFRYTVKQFHQMGELGFFEGRRASLIHGTILEEGPMNPPHRIALELTDTAVRFAFGPGWRFCVQMPLVLGQSTDPEPDIAVVRGTARGTTAHPTTAALVIEIADSSLDYDLTTKAELYATANIPEYWVLDVDGRTLHVFRDPVPLPVGLAATAYRARDRFNDLQSVSPLAVPTATVRVAELLP
jgi:Uma2 family endonuclease